jgi:hypothetical protein
MSKSEVIPFRATPQERQRLEKMAADCSMTISELVRFIVTTKRVELAIVPLSADDVDGSADSRKNCAINAE